LSLDRITLLPGVEPLVRAGVESTLAPANREVERSIEVSAILRQDPRYAALFDPQTSGGLLLAVPEQDVPAVLRRLSELSNQPCAEIGCVKALETAAPQIHIV
jgi:selenide,water dikinase